MEQNPLNDTPKKETESEKLARLFPNATNKVGYFDSHGVLQTAPSKIEAGEKAQQEESEMA